MADLLRPFKTNATQKPIGVQAAPLPSPPRFSEKAALVAAHMEALEDELNKATAYGQQEKMRADLAENRLQDALRQVEKLQSERDDAVTSLAAIEAKLQASASIILDCLSPQSKASAAAHTAVSRAVLPPEDDGRPIPEFLTQEPKPHE